MIESKSGLCGAELRSNRAKIAVSLMELVDNSDADMSLSFQDIDSLPDWLLLTSKEVSRIKLLLGCVWCLPMIRQCIEGSALREISVLIGEDDFSWLLELDDTYQNVPLVDVEEMVNGIEHHGKTILLGLIKHENLRALIGTRMGCDAPYTLLESERAMSAVALVEQRVSASQVAQQEEAA